ncbi:type II secretion system protein [bacterium]|nr:type II secretion system protein [bacterium]
MKRKEGFGLIEILLVVVIIGFLYYTMMKVSINNPIIDKELAKEGIDTTSYPGMINITKEKVSSINQKIKQQENQWQNIE